MHQPFQNTPPDSHFVVSGGFHHHHQAQEDDDDAALIDNVLETLLALAIERRGVLSPSSAPGSPSAPFSPSSATAGSGSHGAADPAAAAGGGGRKASLSTSINTRRGVSEGRKATSFADAPPGSDDALRKRRSLVGGMSGGPVGALHASILEGGSSSSAAVAAGVTWGELHASLHAASSSSAPSGSGGGMTMFGAVAAVFATACDVFGHETVVTRQDFHRAFFGGPSSTEPWLFERSQWGGGGGGPSGGGPSATGAGGASSAGGNAAALRRRRSLRNPVISEGGEPGASNGAGGNGGTANSGAGNEPFAASMRNVGGGNSAAMNKSVYRKTAGAFGASSSATAAVVDVASSEDLDYGDEDDSGLDQEAFAEYRRQLRFIANMQFAPLPREIASHSAMRRGGGFGSMASKGGGYGSLSGAYPGSSPGSWRSQPGASTVYDSPRSYAAAGTSEDGSGTGSPRRRPFVYPGDENPDENALEYTELAALDGDHVLRGQWLAKVYGDAKTRGAHRRREYDDKERQWYAMTLREQTAGSAGVDPRQQRLAWLRACGRQGNASSKTTVLGLLPTLVAGQPRQALNAPPPPMTTSLSPGGRGGALSVLGDSRPGSRMAERAKKWEERRPLSSLSGTAQAAASSSSAAFGMTAGSDRFPPPPQLSTAAQRMMEAASPSRSSRKMVPNQRGATGGSSAGFVQPSRFAAMRNLSAVQQQRAREDSSSVYTSAAVSPVRRKEQGHASSGTKKNDKGEEEDAASAYSDDAFDDDEQQEESRVQRDSHHSNAAALVLVPDSDDDDEDEMKRRRGDGVSADEQLAMWLQCQSTKSLLQFSVAAAHLPSSTAVGAGDGKDQSKAKRSLARKQRV